MSLRGKWERTEEYREKMRKIRKGKRFNTGRTHFKKGSITWIKGNHHSEDARKKMSRWHQGRKLSKETKEKMSRTHKIRKTGKWMLGRHLSVETKKKLSKVRLGIKHHFYGKHFSKEYRNKLSEAHKGKRLSEETKRKISESHKGKKSYLWQGGKSFEPYTLDWTRSLRISIRERDKYTCQLCNERQGDRAFSVHHIDYDKKNCNPNNLITLCVKCHSKTNQKREYWINYFQKLKQTSSLF